MICVYPANCTDFSNNGLGVVTPMSCTVTETLNGEWELTLVHDIDERGKWTRLSEERQTALRFIIRCGTVGSVRRGRLETAAGIRRLRKRNCCAEYPMRSAGNGRERKNLARSDFCGKCRPFILKMER